VKCTLYVSFRPPTATFRRLPVKWLHFRVTSGRLRSRDVLLCHVTASSCELQACRKWNVQYTPVLDLLQPLPSELRSNDVTYRSLPVTWGHVTSFPATWVPPASYSLVGSEMYSIPSFRPSTATSSCLPLKWHHFRVTFGHSRSLHGILCHVTAFSCWLQPCRKWNVQYKPVFGLLQPLPGDFRSYDDTSGSLSVTWGHATSFSVMWLPPPASCSLVGSEMYSIRQFLAFYRHFQVTSGQMTSLLGNFRSPEVAWRNFLWRDYLLLRATALQEVKCIVYASFWPSTATSSCLALKWRHFRVTSGHLRSRDVISCHVTALSRGLQPCRKWNVQYTPVFSLLQPLPGIFRWNDVTSWSLPVTWGHVTSTLVIWLPPPASYKLVGSEMYSTCQFSAFYSHFQVTSGQMTSVPGHFR